MKLEAELPVPVFQLCRLLSEAFGSEPAPEIPIGEPLVTLALHRHQVGPLLYSTAMRGHHMIASKPLQRLEQSYAIAAARRATALKRLHQIAVEFAKHRLDWLALKGTTQAEQLYSDPACRDSADIDILVQPREFRCALETLTNCGFTASDPPLPRIRALRAPLLAPIRDVTLIAHEDRSCAIELHRRLFFAGGRRAEYLRLKATPGTLVPAPAVGPELAFYLIAHGALSFWVRLKWLVDLVPLFGKLSGAETLAVRELARHVGAENSLAASLLLLHALFPASAPTLLMPWLERKSVEAAVQHRLKRYIQMLNLTDDQKGSPLSDAFAMLEASWLLFEAPSTRSRLLMSAPISSLARRIGRALSKDDRALTQPDVGR